VSGMADLAMEQPRERATAAQWTRQFEPHLDAAYRLARWLTGSRTEAEEVVQEACLRTWRASRTDPDDSRAWLLAIVRNAAWTHLRRARPANVVPFDEAARELDRMAGPLPSAEAAAAEQECGASLRQALARLPAVIREVVVLRDIEDLAYREIAATLDLPVGTVMSRLSRGRRRLRAMLAGEEKDARDAD
jgi:RNA polymerase sigma factor (sigma-70 family)